MRRLTVTALVLLTAGALCPARAQNDNPDPTTGSTSTEMRTNDQVQGSADLKFLQRAAAAGLLEVRLGEIAIRQGASEDVKSFGQRMIDDHTRLGDSLKSIASQKNVSVPDNLDKDSQKKVDRLLKLSGRDFDHEFMEQMIKDHEEAIELYEKEARSGKDEDIKGFAQRALPDLNDHLKLAKQKKKTIGG